MAIQDISKETLLLLYRNLLTARLVDNKLFEMFSAGNSGMIFLHRGTGEEAIPIGVCANLRKDDFFLVTITRGRPFLFAKGMSFVDVFASECMRDVAKIGGRSTFFDLEFGILGRSGSLGEDFAIYVGAALAAKLKKTNQVAVCTLGDGAASRGPAHESMILAAAWHLPIVFLIQNNQYGNTTSVRKNRLIENLSDVAKAYGFPGVTVDGNDIIEVYEVSKKYIDRARSGGGPSLIEAKTYRLGGHQVGDPQRYRPKGEVEEWWQKDPLPRYTKRLMDMGLITPEYTGKLEKEIKAELDEAAKTALAAPFMTYEDYVAGPGIVIDGL